MHYKTSVLFGGSGFIGTHLAAAMMSAKVADEIVLADLVVPQENLMPEVLKQAQRNGKLRFVKVDVRQPIDNSQLPSNADLIVNLAAVHREPGHEAFEYFETNVPGAENVCAWAEKVNCNYIVFTSSISVYGPTDQAKDESSPLEPTSPYGTSKLAAEQLHQLWLKGKEGRKLLIVRPGVIFGSGEHGNVTRMLRGILGRYFMYTGNRRTRKSGGYVKELCNSILWMMEQQLSQNSSLQVFNFTMSPVPTVQEYVEGIEKVSGMRHIIPSLPLFLLLPTAYVMHGVSKVFGIKLPVDPTRVRKADRSNNILPTVLQKANYKYQYNFEQAFTDWKKDNPSDWKKNK